MAELTPSTIAFDRLVEIVRERGRDARSVTALAAAPASGKSTLALKLEQALDALEPGAAAVLPMDGYHFDDLVLVPRGLRPRKGAPETFDVAGFGHMLRRLRANDEAEVAVPVFDRKLEIARAGARLIPKSVRHLIVEGNYLLLDRPPWTNLQPLFDTTVSIAVDLEELEARLLRRWQELGLPAAEVLAKVHDNDLVNARLVIAASRPAMFRLAP
jgi:pantothenate kinase